MIRQRFDSGRLARIGTWSLAAITSVTAWINHQAAASAVDQSPQGDGPPATTATVVAPAVPASPDGGLLILRYERAPLPAPPTIVRRVVVEESGGGPAATASVPTQTSPPAATAQAAPPPPPPPPPTALPAPPPLQSSGS